MIADVWADAGVWALVISAVAVFAGTLVQRLAGQGLGLLASPFMAIFLPEYMPAAMLLLGLVVGLSSSAMDFSAIAKSELPAGFTGRILGSVLAAWIASQIVGSDGLGVVIGVTVLIAVGLSLAGWRAKINTPNLFTAGAAAGLMGTLTAIGAPPMAMLYQFEEAKRSRAMQNIFFGFGMIVSITALSAFGLITTGHLIVALTLLPAALIALACSTQVAERFESQPIRPIALSLATLAALFLLGRSLF